MEKKPKSATAYVILEKRYENTKKLYKLKLMVTYKRVQKFYTIVIPGVPAKMSETDFEKCRSEKPRHPFSDYKDHINQVESDARNVIRDMADFSFAEFEKLYFEVSREDKNFLSAIENYEKELKHQGRVGTESSYKCARSALKKYLDEHKKPDPLFNDITVSFLNSWEEWMMANGTSSTTVGIYCRNFRTILNKAKEAALFKPEKYPFGRGGFVIPSSQNIKKALTVSEVGKIYNYPVVEGSMEHRSRDLWMFSYLCNGINLKDIARLRYKNIDHESITFVRSKTERKLKSNQKPIVVPLTTELKAILKRWGNKPPKKEKFVFPILDEGVIPERERALVQQATKTTNKYISRIAKACKIVKPVTTYTARHSFATVMKRSGASIEFISESLGHSNLATTENYLASFELETKRKFAKNLLKF